MSRADRTRTLYCIKEQCLNYAPNFDKEVWDNEKICKIGKCPKVAKCAGVRPSRQGEWC